MSKAETKSLEELREEYRLAKEKYEQDKQNENKKLEQNRHEIQRALNEVKTYKRKRDAARTHHLIQIGAEVVHVCKPMMYLTKKEFTPIIAKVFGDTVLQAEVETMVPGRAEREAEEKEELEEIIQLYEDYLSHKGGN